MVRTRKITEAQFAYCRTCDQWLGNQYWSLSKSVALHKGGTGHSVELFTLADGYPTWARESCGGCGGDLGPSSVYPWHEDDEDCRAIRQPIDNIATLERTP